jgi:hypothetical protein
MRIDNAMPGLMIRAADNNRVLSISSDYALKTAAQAGPAALAGATK